MLIRISIIILLLFLLSSCNEVKKNDHNTLIAIDLNDKNLYSSSVVDSIKYVPLESKEGAYIGNIDKILYNNGFFYILDSRISNSVIVFDEFGRFQFRIKSEGRSPKSFIRANDFDIDSNGDILILDIALRGLVRYNKLGEFKSKMSLRFNSHFFSCVKKGYVFDRNNYRKANDNGNIILTDKIGYVKEEFFEFRQILDDLDIIRINSFSLKKSRESILYSPNYSNNIYSFNGQEWSVSYGFYFEKEELPTTFFQGKNKREWTKYLRSSNYVYNLQNYYENNNFFVCSFLKGNKLHNIVLSKESGEYRLFKPFNNCYGSFTCIGTKDDFFISNINSNKAYELQENSRDVSSALREINIDINSNPILMLYRIDSKLFK